MKTVFLCFLFSCIAITITNAHGGKKHLKDSTKAYVGSSVATEDEHEHHHEHAAGDSLHHAMDESKVTADLGDFPTLHPLIVHFAIVLIIVAAGLQLLNLWWMKKEISWIVTAILLIGVATAWLAANNFHPHTEDLSSHAQRVLDQHDRWADRTINFGIVALLLQLTNLFFFKTRRWAFAIVAVALFLSGYSVARAAHYGSQLVHIEGVGPQGHHLELEDHD